MLCVGLYDGTVAVYDARAKATAPIFQSSVKKGKHTDPVWEVRCFVGGGGRREQSQTPTQTRGLRLSFQRSPPQLQPGPGAR